MTEIKSVKYYARLEALKEALRAGYDDTDKTYSPDEIFEFLVNETLDEDKVEV